MNASTAGKAAAGVDTQCDWYFTYLSFQNWLFTLLPLLWSFFHGLFFQFVEFEYVTQN